MKVINLKSNNFGARPKDAEIKYIVIHYTEIDFESTVKLFTNSKSHVSAHYVINDNGDVIHMIDEENRAWHAGISAYKDYININDVSIGIELVNNGKSLFPQVQINSLKCLVKYLQEKYYISDYAILSHSEIAIGRKIDPGIYFPWREFGVNIDDANHSKTTILYQPGSSFLDDFSLLEKFYTIDLISSNLISNYNPKLSSYIKNDTNGNVFQLLKNGVISKNDLFNIFTKKEIESTLKDTIKAFWLKYNNFSLEYFITDMFFSAFVESSSILELKEYVAEFLLNNKSNNQYIFFDTVTENLLLKLTYEKIDTKDDESAKIKS
jgi:hypothetical protein